MVRLIDEDDHIVVVQKPFGMLSEGDTENSLVAFLKKQTGSMIYPVHRLDKETGGVMVFAKTKTAAAALSEQIKEKTFAKKYYAVINGVPEEREGTFKDLLFRDKQKNKTYVVKRMRKGVREAELTYKIIGKKEGLSLADISLKTGRTHQIRVQFSTRKTPLYGDGKYGGGKGKLALFAYGLTFCHPITKEQLTFTAKPNKEDYPWNLFEEIL